MFRFYDEDSPGLKMGPTSVLVMSVLFVCFVLILHVIGKFRGTAQPIANE